MHQTVGDRAVNQLNLSRGYQFVGTRLPVSIFSLVGDFQCMGAAKSIAIFMPHYVELYFCGQSVGMPL